MKRILAIACIIAIKGFCFGQQLPQYSQYIYNLSTINPGYVTNTPDIISIGALYRQQWYGIEGSPRTANAFAAIPISKKMEFGLNYVNDQIGDAIRVTNQLVNLDYAYVVDLNESIHVSLGMKAGLSTLNLAGLIDDPAIDGRPKTTDFNLGAGVFLFSDDYYLGFSTPNFVRNNLKGADGSTINESPTQFYGIAGYVVEVSNNFKLRPSTVVRYTEETPVTFDLSLNSLILDRFELGVSYRHQDAIVGLAAFNITRSLKIGYAYDATINDLNLNSRGSHEFILLYDFDLLGLRKNYSSPRFY